MTLRFVVYFLRHDISEVCLRLKVIIEKIEVVREAIGDAKAVLLDVMDVRTRSAGAPCIFYALCADALSPLIIVVMYREPIIAGI